MAVLRKSPGGVARVARVGAVRRANAALRRLVPDDVERQVFADAVARYADAVALAAKLRAEWLELGEPSLEFGSMRQPIAHPLVRMIEAADASAHRFAGPIGLDASARGGKRVGVGRPVGAASAPDRVAEPPRVTKLRAV